MVAPHLETGMAEAKAADIGAMSFEDALRELEKNVPQALAAARESAGAARAQSAEAADTVKALSKMYAASAVAAVSTNIEQAAKLLDFAEAIPKDPVELDEVQIATVLDGPFDRGALWLTAFGGWRAASAWARGATSC